MTSVMIGVMLMEQKDEKVQNTKKIEKVKVAKKSDKKVTGNKGKMKVNASTIVIIVGIIVICIPFVILGSILISASKATGTPVLGNRYENDLNPAITEEQITSIVSKIKSDNQVESVNIELVTATLRIYVDMQDSLNEEEATALANSVYESVASTLDVNTYFTKTSTKKMYDLEIHLYNNIDFAGNEQYLYLITTKNSSMSEPSVQVVSSPKDPDVAAQLRKDTYGEEEENDSEIGVIDGVGDGENSSEEEEQSEE